MNKYRPMHHDESGQLQTGEYTSLQIARDQVRALQSAGYPAWIENSEHERVDENGKIL